MIEFTIYTPTYRKTGDIVGDKVTFEFAHPRRPFLAWQTSYEGAMYEIPKGYGVAYVDYVCCRYLVAPQPFNIIIGALIGAWHWMRYGCAYFFSEHGVEYKLNKKARQDAAKGLGHRLEQARADGVREGMRKIQDWWAWVLDNRHLSDEEVLTERKKRGIDSLLEV